MSLWTASSSASFAASSVSPASFSGPHTTALRRHGLEPQYRVVVIYDQALEQRGLSRAVPNPAREIEIIGAHGDEHASVRGAVGKREQEPCEFRGVPLRRRREQLLKLVHDQQRRGFCRRQPALQRKGRFARVIERNLLAQARPLVERA